MSELTQALARGEVVRGAGATTFAPAIIEAYGAAGMDYVWLDLEHKGPSPADSKAIERLVRAANGAEIELLVRLPSTEPWLVRKILDTGVENLLFARVETAAQVRRAIRATVFTYDEGPGERGVGNSHASDWGADGYEPTNERPGVGVMVETAAAVENLDDILAVSGLDFAYPGVSDLSVSLGHPFETDHPAVRDTVDSIRDACDHADVPLGRSVSSPEAVPDAIADGWQLLRFGDEVGAVRRALAAFDDAIPHEATKD